MTNIIGVTLNPEKVYFYFFQANNHSMQKLQMQQVNKFLINNLRQILQFAIKFMWRHTYDLQYT